MAEENTALFFYIWLNKNISLEMKMESDLVYLRVVNLKVGYFLLFKILIGIYL